MFSKTYTAVLAAISSGVLYWWAFCGVDQYYLAWVCWLPLLWAIDQAACSSKAAFGLGWLCGITAHLGVYTFIIGLLHRFADLPWALSVLGYVLLSFGQSALFGWFGWLVFWLNRSIQLSVAWAAPMSLIISEWAYPALFPSYFANSQYNQLVIIQCLDLVGTLGLSGLMIWVSSCLYELYGYCTGKARYPRQALAACLLCLITWASLLNYGFGSLQKWDRALQAHENTVRIGVVQANLGIGEKFANPHEDILRHTQQSLELQAQGAHLIVWPESSYPYAINTTHPYRLHDMLPLSPPQSLQTPILFGALRLDYGAQGKQMYNSAFLADANGQVLGSYDKNQLLMFGEALPWGDKLPQLYKLIPQASHFNRGQHTLPLTWQGITYGVLICYEDILPGFVRQIMQHNPHVLVNITNDAWYGQSHEPKIHLALASMRAVEQRRYLVRAANTGISAIIDPLGRVVSQSGLFRRANLLATVMPLQEITWYQRLGDWPGPCCFCLVALCVAYRLYQNRRGQKIAATTTAQAAKRGFHDASA